MALPGRIPARDLLRMPDRTAATLSPDGTRLAFLAPWKGRLNVWVSDVDGGGERCVTADETRTVLRYFWTDDPVTCSTCRTPVVTRTGTCSAST